MNPFDLDFSWGVDRSLVNLIIPLKYCSLCYVRYEKVFHMRKNENRDDLCL